MNASDDLQRFAAFFMHLAQFYPEHTFNFEVVLPAYFKHLSFLPIEYVPTLFDVVLKRYSFFPKIHDLLKLAREVFPECQDGTPGARCNFCPSGHGAGHDGHVIAHYPEGPFCRTCQCVMPVPQEYSYHPPLAVPQGVPLLPEYGEAPLSPVEVRAALDTVWQAMSTRAERLSRRVQPWEKALLDHEPFDLDDPHRRESLETRRAALRAQAALLKKHEPPPAPDASQSFGEAAS